MAPECGERRFRKLEAKEEGDPEELEPFFPSFLGDPNP